MAILKSTLFLSFLLLGSFAWSQEGTDEALKKTVETEVESSGANEEEKSAESEEPAAAEARQEAPQSSSAGRDVERLNVTGSYIRRTDVEGPSPIVTIDRAQIEASGQNSVGGVLRQSTVSPFGAEAGQVNLKGLGSAKTLVLINGQRAPGTGSSFQSGPVGTDFIPIAAVDRIEILKDGATATYGSDALGGVVNIITRNDIDGFSFANQYNLTTNSGGDLNRTSLAYGKATDTSNFMTSFQAAVNQGQRVSDRDYSGLVLDIDPRRASNYVDDNGDLRAGPNCTKVGADGRCYADRSEFYSEDGYNFDWVTQYSKKLGSETEFYSMLAVGYGVTTGNAPVTLQTPGVGLGLGLSGAETPAAWSTTLPGYSGGDTTIYHQFNDLRNRDVTREYYAGLITGIKGYIGESDWEWDVTVNNQFNSETVTEENVGVFSATKAAIVANTYDPFDTSNRDTTGLGADTFNRNRFMVNWAEFKTNGNLGSFLGFDWASAFGTSFAHFEYSDKRSAIFLNGDAMGQSGAIGSAGRELYAVFAETSGMLGDVLEVQASVRGDFYSDFGNTVNPKLAFRYQPAKWLTFRASGGTGFQAPTLQDMNARLEGFFNNFQDLARCRQLDDCALKSTTASQATNPDLKEENSVSLNFGTIVQPTKNFSFGVDWWAVKVENVIGSAFGQALRIEDDFGPGASEQFGVTIQREGGSPTGEIQRITYQLSNLGTQEAEGLDFSMKYSLKTSFGDFTFSDEFSYMAHFFQQFVSVYGREDIVGRQGVPRWRNNFSIAHNIGSWSTLVTARSTADMLESGNVSAGLESIPSPTQFDIALTYQHSTAGQFQVGVINAGNIRPRFSTTQSIDTTLFRPIETYYMTYRRDF